MKKQQTTWSKKSHSFFEKYAVELQEFWQSGNEPDHGSHMLNMSMEKQKEYMEKQGLRMTYDFVPNGHFAEKAVGKGWHDEIYSNYVECRTCAMTRRILRDEKEIYKRKENVNLYMTITDVRNRKLAAKQVYNCPSCGAPSTVEQLEDMCPYCRTRFKMTDLFPKVTNFFTVKAHGGTKEEVRSRIVKFCLPAAVLGIIWFAIYFNFISPKSDSTFWNCVSALFSGGIFGAIIGYMVWAIISVGRLVKDAAKSVPMLISTSGSQKKFVKNVQSFSPEFSYEFFTNKVVTILRQLLAEERVEDNPYYIGRPADIDGHSIVEYAFKGAVALKRCLMDGPICNVIVDAYMTDYYWEDDRIKKRDDIFRIALTKDLSKKINYNFSLSAIKCKNCGGSFDAARKKKCPYCDSKYAIGNDDWVVTAIHKRQSGSLLENLKNSIDFHLT